MAYECGMNRQPSTRMRGMLTLAGARRAGRLGPAEVALVAAGDQPVAAQLGQRPQLGRARVTPPGAGQPLAEVIPLEQRLGVPDAPLAPLGLDRLGADPPIQVLDTP